MICHLIQIQNIQDNSFRRKHLPLAFAEAIGFTSRVFGVAYKWFNDNQYIA